jgi:oligoendopeptidase F
MLHSNAARLVHKVAENDTYRHDIKVHEVVQKHTRQPKVVMGPRYERVMSAPRMQELHQLDENEKRQLAAAERIGLDPNSNAGHLVRTIAAFGEVEDQKNQEMKRTLMEHTELQKTLYRRAVKTHWDSTRGNTRPPSSPPSERLDEPTLSNAVSPTAKGHSQRSLVGAR